MEGGVPFTITNVKKCLPSEVYQKNDVQATFLVIRSLILCWVSILVLQALPVYLLPVGWFFSSVTMMGIFAIAHDCGHGNLFSSNLANKIIGNICLIPIFYPLEAWRLHHNLHHKNQKSKRSLTAQESKSFLRLINPLFWPYDIAKLILLYFDLSQFAAEEQANARLSVLFTYASVGLLFPLMIYHLGILGMLKLWFVPWILFHFWKNCVRQALPSVSFSYPNISPMSSGWVNQKKQENEDIRSELLTEMSHYSFPSWFEFLCHDINYQIPHYLCPEIPCYNLKKAHQALMNSQWKSKINLYRFGWFSLLQKPSRPAGQGLSPPAPVDEVPEEYRKLPLYKRLNYLHVPLFALTHSLALYGFLFVTPTFRTLLWAILYYFYTGLGITAGYHRLWAHRAYDASWPVRFLLMLGGTGAVEGSIKWWARDHRVHHRYTDTPQDPYNAKRGFWYSHMGWMLINEPYKRGGKVDISDLISDPMILFQHKFYLPLALLMTFVFPTLVGGLGWNDYVGSFFWAGVIRLCFVHHATFFVNSLAHTYGSSPFADTHTPKDSFVTAILTLGEGYHNFHHEFPKDYRNAIKFYQYDPTKWLIRFLAFFGLTYNLHTFPENEVKKGMLQMARKNLDKMATQIDWGPEVERLPIYTVEQVAKSKESGEKLVIIGGIVHDVSKWIPNHPGGGALIEAFIGKDATSAFNGGIYNHSNAGRNMLTVLRIGRINQDDDHHEPLDEGKYEIQFKSDKKD